MFTTPRLEHHLTTKYFIDIPCCSSWKEEEKRFYIIRGYIRKFSSKCNITLGPGLSHPSKGAFLVTCNLHAVVLRKLKKKKVFNIHVLTIWQTEWDTRHFQSVNTKKYNSCTINIGNYFCFISNSYLTKMWGNFLHVNNFRFINIYNTLKQI